MARMETAFKIDLTKIDGEGDFSCPLCGAIISPNDMSEDSYKILEVRTQGEALEEILLKCKKCKSTISLVGFEAYKEQERKPPAGTKRLKGKTDKQILQLLLDGTRLTLAEIAEKLDKKPKVVFKALRKLFEKDKIIGDPKTRSYMIS